MTVSPPREFEGVRAFIAAMPEPSIEALAAVEAREGSLTKPPGALGRLEELTAWLAAWQGKAPPSADRPAAVVFAGNHGVARQGVSAYPAAVTAQMVMNFEAGGAAVNQLCKSVGASFAVVPLELDRPTGDITVEDAMDERDFVAAFAAGVDAVPVDADLLAVGEMGIANTCVAAAVAAGLFGGAPADWVGRGTGVDDKGLAVKRDAVARAIARLEREADPLQIFRRLGGRELAAMAGAVAAARHRRIPVLLDGYVATAAAATLMKLRPDALDHTRAAHVSAEPGHRRLLQSLGMTPLLDLGMRLGEASGAALAISLVKAAVACHTGMATFDGAGVSNKS